MNQAKKTVEFIDWVLFEKFSFEDDFENKQSPAEFHNPLTKYIPDYVDGSSLNESNKTFYPTDTSRTFALLYVQSMPLVSKIGSLAKKQRMERMVKEIALQLMNLSLMQMTLIASLEKGKHPSMREIRKVFQRWYMNYGHLLYL